MFCRLGHALAGQMWQGTAQLVWLLLRCTETAFWDEDRHPKMGMVGTEPGLLRLTPCADVQAWRDGQPLMAREVTTA